MRNHQHHCPARHADVQIIVRDTVDTTYTLDNGTIRDATTHTSPQKTFITYCPACGLWKTQSVRHIPAWLNDVLGEAEVKRLLLERSK